MVVVVVMGVEMIATLYVRCKAVWIARSRGRRKVSPVEVRNKNEALWGIFLWVTRGGHCQSKSQTYMCMPV